MNIFEYGLKQQEKRKIELDTFSECVHEAIQENQEQGKRKIAQFEEKHLSVGPEPPEALPASCWRPSLLLPPPL